MAFPVDDTISKVISILENEVSLVAGISYELHEIKHELTSMRSFLEDADTKGAYTEGEKVWVANVREVAYDVEDIIDELMYHISRPQQSLKFTRLLQKIIEFPNIWLRHRLAIKLRKISTITKSIPERHQRYAVHHVEGVTVTLHDEPKWVRNLRESALFTGNEELVGIQHDKETLLRLLMDEEPRRAVISVVGMGGSDLLRGMIQEFYQAAREFLPKDLNTLSFRQLVETLANFLRPLRYVVVLDDVWNVNLWTEIKVSLPDGDFGSRVLLTTRKENIASSSFGVQTYVHHIQPLGKDEAWALFCLKAFSSNPANLCPLELEFIARDIVGKCQGLPLAIVALGGLMASKKFETEWRTVLNSLNWELSNNPMLEVVKSVLLLSFDDLPYRLKHCFLYCCIFPEDYLIRRNRLIRLWMAEGFIEEVRGLTPEEVGESYLIELGHRNMLQVVKNSSGRPKSCKMHDLMRELALTKSEREKLCFIHDGREPLRENGARRLSTKKCDKKFESWPCISRLRSFFVFLDTIDSPSSLYSLPSGFRLLRVIDVQYVPIRKLPDEVGNLFNLRNMNLEGTCIQELPKSIGRLRNLQSLNLFQTKVKALPRGICNLQNLRYLIVCHYNLELVDDFNYINGSPAPSNVRNLKSLQVLHFVKVNDAISRHVEKLTQLTCIGIRKEREVDERVLCSSIEKLNRLCHLMLMASSEDEVLHLDALSSPPPNLRRLNLIGKLGKVPPWFFSLQSLKALFLSWSRLPEDPLPYIQSLPNLRRLTLVNAYVGNWLCFRTGFCHLKSLILRNFPQLIGIVIEKGAMQSLENLWFSKCMELKMMPQGIEHLTNVQQISLTSVRQ
ncbi:hypothetical protein F2P56_000213 [Juglans regia]|uniref:Disease resistance protein RPM1-like n=1 Tax=Juglans regia TaxID=51240 RepID=A0A833Y7K3_JUGRE|nr:hypothetical protein F2P56_000213 [Juglans regia]